MRLIRNIGIIFEVTILFGPATVFLLMSPVSLLFALDGNASLLPVIAVISGGAIGIITVISLVSYAINLGYIPKTKWIVFGVVSGSSACIGFLISTGFDLIWCYIFLPPVFGVIHLLWLCRSGLTLPPNQSLQPTAKDAAG